MTSFLWNPVFWRKVILYLSNGGDLWSKRRSIISFLSNRGGFAFERELYELVLTGESSSKKTRKTEIFDFWDIKNSRSETWKIISQNKQSSCNGHVGNNELGGVNNPEPIISWFPLGNAFLLIKKKQILTEICRWLQNPKKKQKMKK